MGAEIMGISERTLTSYSCPCGETITLEAHDDNGFLRIKNQWAWARVDEIGNMDKGDSELLCPACVRIVALVLNGRRAQEAAALVFDGIPRKPES